MRRALAAIACLLLPGCALINPIATSTLASAGDKNAATHVADLNVIGALACRASDGSWLSVVGANVVNATAQAVAKVCDDAQPGATPGALPDGAVSAAVTVGAAILAELNASKT